MAFPCATQNELDLNDAMALVDDNISVVTEGANMSCNIEVVRYYQEKGMLSAPAKAANAGGVAVSGLKKSQNPDQPDRKNVKGRYENDD